MHSRITEILACLDTQMVDFRAAIEAVPVARRGVRPSPQRWSVAENIEHLALTERLITKACTKQLAAARDAGLAVETEMSSVLSSLPVEVVASRENRLCAPERLVPTGTDADAALRDLETARAAFRDFVTSCDGLALGEVSFPHPALGPLNMYQWLLFVAGHQARHAAQIRELADQL
jgi:DinB superfamily